MIPVVDGAIALIKDALDRFIPDKTAAANAKAALDQLRQSDDAQQVLAQISLDQAEAQSADPLQHWRGGLGWVCAFGYAYSFVLQPLLGAGAALVGHPVALPQLDISQLSALTVGMLGLGGLHVTERIKGAS